MQLKNVLLGTFFNCSLFHVNDGMLLFQLMGEEPDLDPDITRDFFERNILQLDPSLLTENGMKYVTHFKNNFCSS